MSSAPRPALPPVSFRPPVRPELSTIQDVSSECWRGYLGSYRDRLIPEALDGHFGSADGSSGYAVTVSVGGESLFAYWPPDSGEFGQRAVPEDASGYSLGPLERQDAAGRIRSPDHSLDFLLLPSSLPMSASRRGGVQRISLRNGASLSRLRNPEFVLPGPTLSVSGDFGSRKQGKGTAPVLRQSLGLPRLFLAGAAPSRLALEARRVGTPLDVAMNLKYKRSVVIGTVVLLLLFGATATVAVSGRRAARLADMRMEAAAAQSHQLRTPATGVTLLADNMAQGRLGHSKRVIEYGELLLEHGQRLNEIVDRTPEDDQPALGCARRTWQH